MVEYLYHVDKNDKVIAIIGRNEAHARKLLHRGGVVLVFDSDERVCLTNRSPLKTIFPNCVDSACSFHVKFGQTYAEAAEEELFEETKIKAKPKYLGKSLLDSGPDRMVMAIFRLDTDEKILLDPTEATSYEFYTSDEADRLIKTKKTTSWLPLAWKLTKTSAKGPS